MSAAYWTPDRVGLLRVLWTQGLSAKQIAVRLGGGITRNAVIGKRIRLGLPDRATSTKSYRANKPKPHSAQPKTKAQVLPKLKAEPIRSLRAPERSPGAVRFIDRKPWQCPMFCAGEEGPEGFVCGKPAEFSVWCEACRPLVFVPAPRVAKAA